MTMSSPAQSCASMIVAAWWMPRPTKPTVFRNVGRAVRCTCRKNNGFRKDCRPISKGQLKEVLFRSGDPVDGARTNQSDSEYQRLCRRTGGEFLTRETSGKSEIVLNSRSLTCASREIRSTRPAERPSDPHGLRSEGVLPRVTEVGWTPVRFVTASRRCLGRSSRRARR